jgi:hypothetical protein
MKSSKFHCRTGIAVAISVASGVKIVGSQGSFFSGVGSNSGAGAGVNSKVVINNQ